MKVLHQSYQSVTSSESTGDYNGNTCSTIDITSKGGVLPPCHERLYLDAEKKFIIYKEVEQYDMKNETITQRDTVKFEYVPVDDSVFVFTPPSDANNITNDDPNITNGVAEQQVVNEISCAHTVDTITQYKNNNKIITKSEAWFKKPDLLRVEHDAMIELYHGKTEVLLQ